MATDIWGQQSFWIRTFFLFKYKQRHEISNNVVCATSKASDQPAHTRSLIRACASRLNILLVLSYRSYIIWNCGCTRSSESTLVKLPHRWNSRVGSQARTHNTDVRQYEKNLKKKMLISQDDWKYPSVCDQFCELNVLNEFREYQIS